MGFFSSCPTDQNSLRGRHFVITTTARNRTGPRSNSHDGGGRKKACRETLPRLLTSSQGRSYRGRRGTPSFSLLLLLFSLSAAGRRRTIHLRRGIPRTGGEEGRRSSKSFLLSPSCSSLVFRRSHRHGALLLLVAAKQQSLRRHRSSLPTKKTDQQPFQQRSGLYLPPPRPPLPPPATESRTTKGERKKEGPLLPFFLLSPLRTWLGIRRRSRLFLKSSHLLFSLLSRHNNHEGNIVPPSPSFSPPPLASLPSPFLSPPFASGASTSNP